MRSTAGLTLFAGSILLFGCGKTNSATADSSAASSTVAGSFDESAARAQILAADSAYGRALQSKNLDSLMGYYDPSVVSMSEGMKAVKGAADLRASYAEMLKSNLRDLWFKSDGVNFSNDHSIAWDYGTFGGTYTPPNGKPVKTAGHFLNVWKNAGGRWVMVAEIGNSSP
jgi:ketosteroid isomerase-like protein